MGKKLADPKLCTKCKKSKPRSEFYPHSVSLRGVSSWCKECTCKTTLEKQKADPSKSVIASRKYKLKRDYGLTPEKYEQMLQAQGHRCAMCGTDKPGGRGRFAVDHCHFTRKVRGLLCNLCNLGLGAFQDDTDLMQKAIEYVKSKGVEHGLSS